MRVDPGSLPHRAMRPQASHAPPTALRPKAILLESLEMNWVLVDDTKGNHRAQMQWVVER